MLFESLNKTSEQFAIDNNFFGPVYHGTTEENRENIKKDGFKIIVGEPRTDGTRHGYPNQAYHADIPPPIHHLGYGVYFTTIKDIAKKFNNDTTKGLKKYYLKIDKLETINWGSSKTMMNWWIQNGYDKDLAKQSENGRVEATKALTNTLKSKFDAVWYKGKSMYRLLDGDQIVVFDTNNIYEIDDTLTKDYDIGSKVIRNSDKYDYTYDYDSNTNQNIRRFNSKPTILKGTIGVITNKQDANAMRNKYGNDREHWSKNSNYVYTVKWSKGGTEYNALDDDITPYKKNKIIKTIEEEINNLFEVRYVNPRMDMYDNKPLIDNETIVVYHGFYNFSEALLAAKFGLTGKERADRRYSYEYVNNPKGLFVSVSFDVLKNNFASSGVIMEFATKMTNLEAPVWAGGRSYFVQGEYTSGFKDDSDRYNQMLANREKQKSNKFPLISKSSRPELAQTIFDNPERQALFVGDLNPNMIKSFWYNERRHVHNKIDGEWVRLSRNEFLKKFYKDEYLKSNYSGGNYRYSDKYHQKHDKIFKPNDNFDIKKFKEYLKDAEYDYDEFLKYYVYDWDENHLSYYLYPKQIEQLKHMFNIKHKENDRF